MRAAPAEPVSNVVKALGALVSFSPELWTVPLAAVRPAEILLVLALNSFRVFKAAVSHANPKRCSWENEPNPTQSL